MWNEILINLGRLNIPHTCRSSWAGFIKYFTRQQRQWRTNTCSVCMHKYFFFLPEITKMSFFILDSVFVHPLTIAIYWYKFILSDWDLSNLTFYIFLMMKNIYSVPHNTRVILSRRYIYILKYITSGALWLILIETWIFKYM